MSYLWWACLHMLKWQLQHARSELAWLGCRGSLQYINVPIRLHHPITMLYNFFFQSHSFPLFPQG